MSDAGNQFELHREVYEHLRRLARTQMANERAAHTLQPTALVHEAVIKLSGRPAESFQTQADFIAAAAEAMRQVLVDHARRKQAEKRGGGAVGVELPAEFAAVAPQLDDAARLTVDEMLKSLDQEDPQLATIVKLRVFGGMTTEAIASLLDCSRKTVERRWRFAAATLRDRLRDCLE